MPSMETAAQAVRSGAEWFRQAGIETARLDAELLLGHVLGITRTRLHGDPDRVLRPEERAQFEALARRRAAREPLPHLLGGWEFMGLRLTISPDVLIPRPETETLVEALAGRLPPDPLVLDVGTGSGCIAFGILALRPDARVVALEPARAAISIASRNARDLGFAGRVTFIHGRFPGPARDRSPFSAIASNPPYIPTGELAGLQPEVRDYEPRMALDGGPDGLTVLRKIAREAAAMLQPEGWIAVEVAAGQHPQVARLLSGSDVWADVTAIPDLTGTPRVVLAKGRPCLPRC